jgi:hypothetical protein
LKGGTGGNLSGISNTFVRFESVNSPGNQDYIFSNLEVYEPSSGAIYPYWTRSSLYQKGIGIYIQADGIGVAKQQTNLDTAYKLRTLVPNNVSKLEIGYVDSGFYLNGIVSVLRTDSVPWTPSTITYINFSSCTKKQVLSSSNETSLSVTELKIKEYCNLFYTPQDYIKYTDTPSRTNFTRIPNRGTLGNTYDLTANNVPEGWFLPIIPDILFAHGLTTCFSSIDGTNWSTVSIPDSGNLIGSARVGNRIVVLEGGVNKRLFISDDGLKTFNQTVTGLFPFSICSDGVYFYIGTYNGTETRIKRSEDGVNWSNIYTQFPNSKTPIALTFGNGTFFVAMSDNVSNMTSYYKSVTGCSSWAYLSDLDSGTIVFHEGSNVVFTANKSSGSTTRFSTDNFTNNTYIKSSYLPRTAILDNSSCVISCGDGYLYRYSGATFGDLVTQGNPSGSMASIGRGVLFKGVPYMAFNYGVYRFGTWPSVTNAHGASGITTLTAFNK